jgi:hypothetical protein
VRGVPLRRIDGSGNDSIGTTLVAYGITEPDKMVALHLRTTELAGSTSNEQSHT